MPQISLKISNNVDITQVDFHPVFFAIHEALKNVPDMNVATCQSGVIQEAFSYVGHGDKNLTKLYLEICWLETSERIKIKKTFAQGLLDILKTTLVPQLTKQNLICLPRVRIIDLGRLNQDYHID